MLTMLGFFTGLLIGIYLGSFYDFRPTINSVVKASSDRLPPKRKDSNTKKGTGWFGTSTS